MPTGIIVVARALGNAAVYSFGIVVAGRVGAVAGGRHGGRYEVKGLDWIGGNNSSMFAIPGVI